MTVGRKRMRSDYVSEDVQTPVMVSERERWQMGLRRDIGSPPPLVNTTYAIAGGLDTPGLALQQADEREAEYLDVGYRRQLSGEESGLGDGAQLARREGSSGEGWGMPLLYAVGGVVGKVWEFCKTNAFRGFMLVVARATICMCRMGRMRGRRMG